MFYFNIGTPDYFKDKIKTDTKNIGLWSLKTFIIRYFYKDLYETKKTCTMNPTGGVIHRFRIWVPVILVMFRSQRCDSVSSHWLLKSIVIFGFKCEINWSGLTTNYTKRKNIRFIEFRQENRSQIKQVTSCTLKEVH